MKSFSIFFCKLDNEMGNSLFELIFLLSLFNFKWYNLSTFSGVKFITGCLHVVCHSKSLESTVFRVVIPILHRIKSLSTHCLFFLPLVRTIDSSINSHFKSTVFSDMYDSKRLLYV
uniref:Putative uncharacterized protein YPL035C n=1 Tax=Saccharomyces cerevisiae (strain ATCC 204508 / S288c) TaxID=559292 RepID=YP035_YEAST|nr:RecName: Full=Putative uncharacterized protein YPL035C [Saccharomyces cerevisiae S288C]AAB68191.1 Ypl035cp [Saccharomyces cerevisiae]